MFILFYFTYFMLLIVVVLCQRVYLCILYVYMVTYLLVRVIRISFDPWPTVISRECNERESKRRREFSSMTKS